MAGVHLYTEDLIHDTAIRPLVVIQVKVAMIMLLSPLLQFSLLSTRWGQILTCLRSPINSSYTPAFNT